MTRPKPLPKIAKCDCGGYVTQCWHHVDVGYAPAKHTICCWTCDQQGPLRQTERGAIRAWNKLMEGKG